MMDIEYLSKLGLTYVLAYLVAYFMKNATKMDDKKFWMLVLFGSIAGTMMEFLLGQYWATAFGQELWSYNGSSSSVFRPYSSLESIPLWGFGTAWLYTMFNWVYKKYR